MAEDLEIAFGHRGGGGGHQGAGWSTPEPDGAWMVDARSTLAMPRPALAGDYLLSLDLETFVGPGHAFQRLSVRVNGVAVANLVLRGGGVAECWVPWPALAGAPTGTVELWHPDGWSPSESGAGDQRVLSFYLRTLRLSLLTEQASALDPAPTLEDAPPPVPDAPDMHALVLDFESLGPGSTLGLVQRRHGAEPLGLFRFGRAPLDGLLSVLEDDFDADALGRRASLVLDPDTRAYALVDPVHGFEWHTGLHDGQADPAALERQWLARLPWLARRFHEVLEGGERILVLCDEDAPTDPARVSRLAAALRRRGRVTLLWVGEAGDARAAGDVEWAGDGLLRGWADGSPAAWQDICRRAHRLWKAARVRQTA